MDSLALTAVLLFVEIGLVGLIVTTVLRSDNRIRFHRLKEFIIMKDKEILDSIDSATNDLAERIAARDAKIKDAGELTPELEAEGQAIVARLKSLAADPTNPVPAEPPVAVDPGTGDAGTSGSGQS